MDRESFFEKLGRSLKLEDEQYEGEAAPENYNLQDNKNNMENLEEQTENLEEENLNDLEQEYPDEPRANLAVAKPKTKAKQKTSKKTKEEPKKSVLEEEDAEEGRLTIDVYETDNDIVIKSTIAGVDPDALDINITSDSVSIRGERIQSEKVSAEDYFYQECYWGAFSRSVILPTEIDPDKSEAAMDKGILTIRLPKLSKTQQKKLQVKKLS